LPTHTAQSLEAQACQATKLGSQSFYFASRFFPAELRRRAYAIYWFCRTTDDLVDEAPSRDEGERALNAWETEFNEKAPTNPILKHFHEIARECEIPAEYPLDLIAGCRMDLHQARYANFDDLKLFCYRVASTVGLMMCHAIGFTRDTDPAIAKQHAIQLGIAMQLTNILRDIATDLKLGRIYIPTCDLESFEYPEAQLRAGSITPQFRELMKFQADRARRYYDAGVAGIPMLKPEGRFAVEIAAKVYSRILDQIETLDYNVFAHRAVVPTREKYWITAKSIATAQLARFTS
jgi:phytoene synthase